MAQIETFLQLRQQRRAELNRHYGFHYSCTVCNLIAPALTADTDLRRDTRVLRQQTLAHPQPAGPIDFRIHATHRWQELRHHEQYIANLVTLGALDGKLT